MPDHDSGGREDRAREDYHDPTAGFGGAAPARSALTLRLVLASFGLIVCTLGAAAFVILANAPVLDRDPRLPGGRGRRGHRGGGAAQAARRAGLIRHQRGALCAARGALCTTITGGAG